MHPVVEGAARGDLPQWASMDEKRERHVERVAALLEDWAWSAQLDDAERVRWVAAGYLHDSVKGVSPDELRESLDGTPMVDWPDALLHGPAAAAFLRRDGVRDEGLLHAVTYHTLGHPDLQAVGRALYAADFLEPGRDLRNEWRGELRRRMPGEMGSVVKEILRARVVHLLEAGRPVRGETMAFWNALAGGKPWAGASEL